jgi:glycosyltransferase involved in cell wall biosynthesis
MSKEGVSIIIPTYNRAKSLERVLPSYLDQKYVREIIIVDDGSIDDTEEVIKKFDNKIHYIRHVGNNGLPAARNTGIKHATSDFVFFGEDDIELFDECIQNLVNSYIKLQNQDIKVGAVASKLLRKDNYSKLKGQKNVYAYMSPFTGELYFDYGIDSKETIEVPFAHASCLIPRKLFNEVGHFDSKNYIGNYWREETDFQFRLRRRGYKIFYEPKAVMMHHADQMGGSYSSYKGLFSGLKHEYYTIHNHTIFLLKNMGYKFLYMSPFFIAKRILNIIYFQIKRVMKF